MDKVERKVLYLREYDGANPPCPFCLDADEPIERTQVNVPFEKTMMKIYVESGDPLVNINVSAMKKLSKRSVTAAPMLLLGNTCLVGTKGKKFVNSVIDTSLEEWKLPI